jgi:hypothetical protein
VVWGSSGSSPETTVWKSLEESLIGVP